MMLKKIIVLGLALVSTSAVADQRVSITLLSVNGIGNQKETGTDMTALYPAETLNISGKALVNDRSALRWDNKPVIVRFNVSSVKSNASDRVRMRECFNLVQSVLTGGLELGFGKGQIDIVATVPDSTSYGPDFASFAIFRIDSCMLTKQ